MLIVAVSSPAETRARVELDAIRFDENRLSLSNNGELLFSSVVTVPQYSTYSTLFHANLSSDGQHIFQQLTFFPEEITFLTQTRQLQIQNRFGVFRSDESLRRITAIRGYPSFARGQQIAVGKIEPVSSSPDARYIIYFIPRSVAYGDLVLHDLATGRRVIVAEEVGISLQGPPVIWSPQSTYFVYMKEGSLFYFSVAQLEENRVIAEPLRLLGEGRTNNIQWSDQGRLHYISGSLVYQVRPSELFSRNIYADILGVGRIAGKIPFHFDPNFDKFWISPGADKLLLRKGSRSIFLYLLSEDDVADDAALELPYLLLPANTTIQRVVWSQTDQITILTSTLRGTEIDNKVYRLRVRNDAGSELTIRAENDIIDVRLSPNEELVAALHPEQVTLRDYETWEVKQTIPHSKPLHAIWESDTSIIIAGAKIIERWNIPNGKRDMLIALSQAEEYGFRTEIGMPYAIVGGEYYDYESVANGWVEAKSLDESTIAPPERKTISANFRVYSQPLPTGRYHNAIMVRNIQGVDTNPLFAPPTQEYEQYPQHEEPIDFDNFSHGSRIRQREVAFVFNAADSAEGLSQILNTLHIHNIRATFFLSGNFITRNPAESKAIADAGHEVGSLFFAHFDMTDTNYLIDEEFVQQGLARNEDLFFANTGRELSLIWHAPYYLVNSNILAASKKIDYTYIGRDVDSGDWVPRRGSSLLGDVYMPSNRIVERIIEKKRPGSIISMRIGIPREDTPYGGRDDYLFQRLDLLINRLTQRGYRIVSVSELINNAR